MTTRILGIVAIVTAFVVGTTRSLTIPVSASNDCQGQKGFERADCQIHENLTLEVTKT